MSSSIRHLSTPELEAGLEHIRQSPRDRGILELIVIRPTIDARQIPDEAQLDVTVGLVGDNWLARGSDKTPDGSAHPEKQLTIMNSRAAQLVAQSKGRWPLAGDQLFIDIDLTDANLPAGTRLSLGEALIEVTPPPHNGCDKFTSRFGLAAMKFVNSPVGKLLHLRGINAKVIRGGTIRVGDVLSKS